MAPRLSGLQREVLSLYRKILRETLKKDRQNHTTPLSSLLQGKGENPVRSSTQYAATEFRRQAESVKKSDFKRVEYMIRKGEKQVKLMQMPGVKVVGGSKNLVS